MKQLTITLTPCRSNPRRYMRYVIYRRVDDGRLMPFRVNEEAGRLTIDPLPWRDVRESSVDPEFAEAWRKHIAVVEHPAA